MILPNYTSYNGNTRMSDMVTEERERKKKKQQCYSQNTGQLCVFFVVARDGDFRDICVYILKYIGIVHFVFFFLFV